MKEVFRSNDPVSLSFVTHCLSESDITPIKLDQHASIIEGSIGAIQQRIMVIDDEYQAALDIISKLDV